MPAIGKFECKREADDDHKKMKAIHWLCALKDDAFDHVGDVFAFVHGGFDYFENFLPLDDLDGVFFFVEELRNQSTANTVAFIFITIDLNTMCQRLGWILKGTDGRGNFRRGEKQNLSEFKGTRLDGGDAVQDEAARAASIRSMTSSSWLQSW